MTAHTRDTSSAPSAVAGSATTHGHLPALDGIRGAAVLMVMLCHFTAVGLPHTVVGTIVLRTFDAGWTGVDLFFVLSGFLITGILYDAKSHAHYFRRFYTRRTLRIFPLYYGFLIAFFWILPHLHRFTPGMQQEASRQGWLWLYGTNLLLARTAHWMFDVDWMKLGHFWTLAIEEQFYLVWPIVVLRLSRRALIRVCIAIVGIAIIVRTTLLLLGASPLTVGVFTVCRFDSLAMGGLAALLLRGDARWLFDRARRLAPLLLILMVELTIWRRRWAADDPVVQSVGFTVLGAFFASLLVLVIAPAGGLPTRVFSNRILRWFGRYSYAMYVFHVALLPLFARLAPIAILSSRLGSGYAAVAAYTVMAITLTSILAYFSWHAYEKHFLALRRMFDDGDGESVPRFASREPLEVAHVVGAPASRP